jgi:hypothetical protein
MVTDINTNHTNGIRVFYPWNLVVSRYSVVKIVPIIGKVKGITLN